MPQATRTQLFLYSTDRDTDELVGIDSATGRVGVIGDLEFDARSVDLVSVGSQLFAINNSDFGVTVDLHELNPTTGASISSVQVSTASGLIPFAEGLAQVDGQLKIAFHTSIGCTFCSDALGDLALNGLISNSTSGAGGGNNFDMDGLGVDAAVGQLYGLDTRPGVEVEFCTVNESPFMTNTFKIVDDSDDSLVINDLVIQGNSLFAVDKNNGMSLSRGGALARGKKRNIAWQRR